MIPKFLLQFFGRLKFPWLFAITASLFGIDFITWDPVPFMDELLLGLTTLMLGAWRARKTELKANETSPVEQPPKTNIGVDSTQETPS